MEYQSTVLVPFILYEKRLGGPLPKIGLKRCLIIHTTVRRALKGNARLALPWTGGPSEGRAVPLTVRPAPRVSRERRAALGMLHRTVETPMRIADACRRIALQDPNRMPNVHEARTGRHLSNSGEVSAQIRTVLPATGTEPRQSADRRFLGRGRLLPLSFSSAS